MHVLPQSDALDLEFQRIKRGHREAIKKTVARIILGPSVVRVYASGTKRMLMPVIARLDVDALPDVKDQSAYSRWFDSQVAKVARVIRRHNPNNSRIHPGVKWGHATKIVALFVRDLVVNSRYFPEREAERLSYFIHAPIDGVVIRRLAEVGIRLPISKIKDISSRQKFYHIQDILTVAAGRCGVPRAWFDDNWGDRQ